VTFTVTVTETMRKKMQVSAHSRICRSRVLLLRNFKIDPRTLHIYFRLDYTYIFT